MRRAGIATIAVAALLVPAGAAQAEPPKRDKLTQRPFKSPRVTVVPKRGRFHVVQSVGGCRANAAIVPTRNPGTALTAGNAFITLGSRRPCAPCRSRCS